MGQPSWGPEVWLGGKSLGVVGFRPEFGHYWSVTFGKSFLPAGFGAAVVVAGY